jgi:CheY-like chemotaxis protein
MPTTEQPAVSEEFGELVREALLHLYEPAFLQTHPFAFLVGEEDATAPPLRGKLLFQILREGIEALCPTAGTARNSRAWRTYQLVELRYVEGMRAAEVIKRLAISKAQYQRDHARALQAIAAFLRDRWQMAAVPVSRGTRQQLAATEAEYVASHLWITAIDLVEMLSALVTTLTPVAEENAIALHFHAPRGLPHVQADRVALRQIFLGLLSTALDRTPGGRLDVSVSQVDEGIDIQILAQAPIGVGRAVVPEPELYVIRRFVSALGGQLDVQGDERSGSWRATVTLPIVHRSVVLVLDNQPDFIGLVSRYLKEYPWEVIGASDVSQARALLRTRRPNVILVDVILPGEDGWDLLLALRSDSQTKEIPVIVCSVLYEPQVARALGAVGYLPKPISQQTLLEAILPWQQGLRAPVVPTQR